MEITHDVTIDLLRPRQNVIRVVQEDSTRTIRLKLLSNNQNYNVADDLDEGETLLKFVEFKKSDGHGGMYDTTSTGETAVELEDSSVPNVWLVNLDGQCFTCPGWTQVNVRFETEAGLRIHTFAIMVDVEPTASSDTESTDWGELNSIADLRNAVQALNEQVQELSTKSGLSEEVKQALLNCFAHVYWIDDEGPEYYNALENALYPPANLLSISAVFEQDGVIFNTDSLDVLRPMLTVTAHYDDQTSNVVTDYVLSGTLVVGTSTVTVSYGGKTTTFNVTVSRDIDYTENPLDGVNWNDNYGYNTNTGELIVNANYHCTNKFTVQNCLYTATTSNSNNKYPRLHMWDSEDTYMGNVAVNAFPISCVQLKSDYQYAIEYRNTNADGANSEISMMPVDNRETAVDPFVVNLVDYKDVLELQTSGGISYFRIPKESFDFSDYGVTNANKATVINRINYFGGVGGQSPAIIAFRTFRVTTTYVGGTVRAILLEFAVPGVSTLEAMQAYLEENTPVVRFN